MILRFLSLVVLALTSLLLYAQPTVIQPADAVRINAPDQLDKPYVILISLDGYRYDYTARFQPPNLSRFIEQGVSANSLIPCFPSKTFPNHYSIVTGMYPEKHDLVNNTFYAPDKRALYKISNRAAVEDGSWYKGTPLWVQAGRAGMVSSSFFFVGSEADVGGLRPSNYYQYDGSVPNQTRIQQAIDWLRLPAETRPHLITLYFSDMDDAGHRYGPNDDEKLEAALLKLDTDLGLLFEAVNEMDLPVNIVIVSDHGMAAVKPEERIPTESLENDSLYRLVNSGPVVHVYLKEGTDLEETYQYMRSIAEHFQVYKTAEAPFFKNNPENPRLGDLLLIADYPHYFSGIRRIMMQRKNGVKVSGEHGFDPAIPDMHGIFYARGPAFKQGFEIPSFENIHIYPLICSILGLEIPGEVDGRAAVLRPLLSTAP
ncbi:MAG: alkaline phosphatase family protein, partial [Phaeodactylibacter sp.]|nr:alkaline phosphatase family protein [Phaeodactylibacter sp.]